MKKIFLLIIIAATLLSCSKSPKEKAKELVSSFCHLISDDFTEEKLSIASKIYDSLINSDDYKEFMNQKEFRIALNNELETCFRSLVFKKTFSIKALNKYLQGNAKDYIVLDTVDNGITYLGDESPAFRITLFFKSIKKFEKEIIDIDGIIYLLDSNQNNISNYNIHPTPDLINIIKQGAGIAQVNTYLEPMWDAFALDPFKLASSSISLMKKVVYYKINLNIQAKEKENIKSSNKNTDDLLDSLIIQD